MKPQFKLLLAFCAFMLFIVYACNKDAQPNAENNYAAYKEWVHAHAGAYSNETIAVKTKDGNIITGSLNWNKLTKLIFEGKTYVYIPFSFQVAGRHTLIYLTTAPTKYRKLHSGLC